MRRIRVWDLPTRLFHWLLAAVVVGSFVSVKIGGNAMVWHGRFGYAALALLIFRLAWGFAGPVHARFASFIRGPRTVLASIRGEQPHLLGHSPLAAWSVMAMLLFFFTQAITGLFTSDDILFDGPMAKRVSHATVELMGSLHRLNEWVLISLVVLHVLAIVFYRLVKKRKLTQTMITGDAVVDTDRVMTLNAGAELLEGDATAGLQASRDDVAMRARALVIFALAAGLVAYLSR